MGLDLFHAIPSAKTRDTFEYLTMDEFKDNPKFLEKHSHLLTEVDETEWDFEILVFPDKLTKDLITERTPSYKEKLTLVGNIDNLNLELSEVAMKNSIRNKEPLILKSIDYQLTKETAKEIYYYTVSFETGSKKIQVLYWATKGYQRKGMNRNFYDDFENRKLYFDKASVLKASSYLKPTSDDGSHNLKTHFRGNFVDNFIEGESMFFGSW
ncbi:hypothetical protein [Chryseosolibacter indicus]|uniref:Uncharacterized protein n=1 Tax=Chryseosolibacter indicus TaxID=2782351 RepID=A0ABS5VWH6_9BACT|nr:hypothetical protein [Chryseosolibacter indicus]MBT1705185.1 hypothetical protein [Chryseosolibacter indicus]